MVIISFACFNFEKNETDRNIETKYRRTTSEMWGGGRFPLSFVEGSRKWPDFAKKVP